MAAALRLARRGAGQTWPNPSVGAILVQGSGPDAHVVGRAVTAAGGRPHAETLALQQAGDAARGATCYVTLEPCSHYAKTPPCVNAILEAGVARVVAAATDPDPRVAGHGFKLLAEAGVEVVTGVLAGEAEWHNRGHIKRITHGRPFTLLKLAISADGAIGRHGDGQVAITGAAVKREVHLARAEVDAIMVGIGTVLADDPHLTCRIDGLERRSPLRIVLDSEARTPLDANVVVTAAAIPTWILVAEDADRRRTDALRRAGVAVFAVPRDDSGQLCLDTALKVLGGHGLTALLVEGGARLAESLVERDLADLVDFYYSTRRIGENRIPALHRLPLEAVTASGRYRLIDDRRVGDDLLHQYKRVA